jgi:hypothetical protein
MRENSKQWQTESAHSAPTAATRNVPCPHPNPRTDHADGCGLHHLLKEQKINTMLVRHPRGHFFSLPGSLAELPNHRALVLSYGV